MPSEIISSKYEWTNHVRAPKIESYTRKKGGGGQRSLDDGTDAIKSKPEVCPAEKR